MRYRPIIEWIDAELARLRAVRHLLAVTPDRETRRAIEGVEEKPKIRRTTGKRRGRPPGSSAKKKAAVGRAPSNPAGEPHAFAGSFPLHPVAVPAAEVRSGRPASAPEPQREEPQAEDGTLESLMREATSRRTLL